MFGEQKPPKGKRNGYESKKGLNQGRERIGTKENLKRTKKEVGNNQKKREDAARWGEK